MKKFLIVFLFLILFIPKNVFAYSITFKKDWNENETNVDVNSAASNTRIPFGYRVSFDFYHDNDAEKYEYDYKILVTFDVCASAMIDTSDEYTFTQIGTCTVSSYTGNLYHVKFYRKLKVGYHDEFFNVYTRKVSWTSFYEWYNYSYEIISKEEEKLNDISDKLDTNNKLQQETNDKLDKNNQLQQETNDKLDETNKELGDINDNITSTDTSDAEDKANGFFSNFDDNDYGLSDVITMPLNVIKNITSTSCTPLVLPIPFVNTDVTLPCMNTIYSQFFGNILTIYQTITTGMIGYWVCINIFAMVKGFKDPDSDNVEVMEL